MTARMRAVLIAVAMLASLAPGTALATTATVPSAPSSIRVLTGNGYLQVTWTAPLSDGGSTITGYHVYRSDTYGNQGEVVAAVGSVLTWNDMTITPRQTYYYEVTALNAIGESAPSAQDSGAASGPPSAPTNVVATAGNTSVTLSWAAPSNNGGYPIIGYSIYRSTTSGAESLLTTVGSVTTYTNTSLTNGTAYYYKVAASSAIGTGAQSSEVSAKPAPTAPAAPASIAAASGIGFVKITWTSPATNGGSTLTGYRVYRADSGVGSKTQIGSTSSSVMTWTDTTGIARQTYVYSVTAVNAIGQGASSAQISTSSSTLAGAPSSLVATAKNAAATLTWGAPADNGGSAVSGYIIYRATTSGAESKITSVGNVFTYTNTSLTDGVTYYYKVAAITALGTGAQSAEVSAKPMPTPPGSPATLTVTPGTGLVKLVWTAPASTGGSSITGYRVYRSDSSGGAKTQVASLGSVLSWSDTTGVARQTYSYTVTAVNVIGEGPSSVEVAGASAVPPTAPASIAAVPGYTAATITWSAPSDNGGSPVTGYVIYRSTTSGAEVKLTTVSNVLTYTNSSLTNGVTYYYRVAAVTAMGTGAMSAEVSATPANQVPGAATLSASTSTTVGTKLSWRSPTSNGSTITGYRIYRGTTPGTETFLTQVAVVTAFADTTTTSGVTYSYRITALNGVGEGALSNEASAKAR